MRRLFVLVLVLSLLLALSACDLRNRQNSEDFIPTGSGEAFPGWLPDQGEDPASSEFEQSTVKTVLAYEGEIPMSMPPRSYSFQLPMIDLGGAEAMACNQEIEERFGPLIQQSLEAIERYEDPIMVELGYSSFIQDGILTLRIVRRDLEDGETEAWYSVDAETGEAVTVEMLFSAADVSGSPDQVLQETVEKRFQARFGVPNNAAVTTAFNRTLDALFPLTVNRMHLTESGNLIVAVEFFSPDGDSSVETLLLP